MIYGSKNWMVAGAMLKVLERLHNWSFRRIAGRMTRHKTVREL